MDARFGFRILALLASVCWTSTASATPGEPDPPESAPREESSPATAYSAEVVLAGPAGENAELSELIEELLAAVSVTPHSSRIGGVRRVELLDQAARPSSGQARVWVTLSGPNLALLLFAGPSGERYLVRQVPLRNGLDELGRERIAQVLQSSMLTLLRGEAGMTRAEMRVAVEKSEGEAVTGQPSRAAPRGAVRAEPPHRQAPSARSFASPRLGLGYLAAWTGHAMSARHGPALHVGLDDIGGTLLHLGLVLQRDFDQLYQGSQVGVRAQTTSVRLMLGGRWPLGDALGLYARAGAGLDATRVEPTRARESTVQLRGKLTDFTAVSRAELGSTTGGTGGATAGAGDSTTGGTTGSTGGTGGTTGGTGGTEGGCTGTLEEVLNQVSTDCPATYDATDAWLESCEGVTVLHWSSGYSGTCNGFLAAEVSWGTHGQTCYYDETSRQLVGAEVDEDLDIYCEETSSTMVGGQYPAQCPLGELTSRGACN